MINCFTFVEGFAGAPSRLDCKRRASRNNAWMTINKANGAFVEAPIPAPSRDGVKFALASEPLYSELPMFIAKAPCCNL